MLRRHILILSGVAAASLVTACGSSSSSKNLFELIRGNADLSVLGDALISADLAVTLQAAGSYTVLAPNNAAFVSLLAEIGMTKDQLFADKPLLTSVLKYHLLPGEINSNNIPLNMPLATVQGASLKVDKIMGVLTITDGRNRKSQIIQMDLDASNGIVHVIDKVLLPPL